MVTSMKEIGRRLFELRRSGAAGKHQDERDRRMRTRKSKSDKEIKNSSEEE